LLTSCLSISTSLLPFSIFLWVDSSKSDANCANAANSLNVASSNLKVHATFFIIFVCAAPHTLDTDNQTLIAGLTHELNKSASRKICQSVIEITFVGIYADTSPACVSIIGNAVTEPPPYFSSNLAALSNNLECK